MSPLIEMRPSTGGEITFLYERRKREHERPQSNVDNLFQQVWTSLNESKSGSLTLIFDGDRAVGDAYRAQQSLRKRMRDIGYRISTAMEIVKEAGQAKLVIGPYKPKV